VNVMIERGKGVPRAIDGPSEQVQNVSPARERSLACNGNSLDLRGQCRGTTRSRTYMTEEVEARLQIEKRVQSGTGNSRRGRPILQPFFPMISPRNG